MIVYNQKDMSVHKRAKAHIVVPNPNPVQNLKAVLVNPQSKPATIPQKTVLYATGQLQQRQQQKIHHKNRIIDVKDLPWLINQFSFCKTNVDIETVRALLKFGALFYTTQTLKFSLKHPIAFLDGGWNPKDGVLVPVGSPCMYVGKMGYKFRDASDNLVTLACESFIMHNARVIPASLENIKPCVKPLSTDVLINDDTQV